MDLAGTMAWKMRFKADIPNVTKSISFPHHDFDDDDDDDDECGAGAANPLVCREKRNSHGWLAGYRVSLAPLFSHI